MIALFTCGDTLILTLGRAFDQICYVICFAIACIAVIAFKKISEQSLHAFMIGFLMLQKKINKLSKIL